MYDCAQNSKIYRNIQLYDYLFIACVGNGSHVLPAQSLAAQTCHYYHHLLNEGNWGYKVPDGRGRDGIIKLDEHG